MIKFTMSYVFHIGITGQFVAVIPEKKIPEKVHAFRQDLCSYTHLNIRVAFTYYIHNYLSPLVFTSLGY